MAIELKARQALRHAKLVEPMVDLVANGDVVGFDIDHASKKLDLSKIETIALPRRKQRVRSIRAAKGSSADLAKSSMNNSRRRYPLISINKRLSGPGIGFVWGALLEGS